MIDKIKRVWRENKILFVLAIILLVCVLVFTIVSLTYFYGASDNVYGDRLDATKKVPLDKKLFTDIKETLESDEIVSKVAVKLRGKIVYINIIFNDGSVMDDAKKVAESAVSLFNEDELQVYDLQFTIKTTTNNEAGFTLMGARNSNGSGTVVWNNYTIEEDESSAEE